MQRQNTNFEKAGIAAGIGAALAFITAAFAWFMAVRLVTKLEDPQLFDQNAQQKAQS